ncbi:uncharacterized protein RHO17_005217 isoform 2-T3 [Thomomys bottae]
MSQWEMWRSHSDKMLELPLLAGMGQENETVNFEDVAINFTLEEWALLSLSQRKLYQDVMGETFKNLASIEKKQGQENSEVNQNSREEKRTIFLERLYGSEEESQFNEAFQQNVEHTMNKKTLPRLASFKNYMFGETILAPSPMGMPFRAHTGQISFQYQDISVYVDSHNTHKEYGRAYRKFHQGKISCGMHNEENPFAAKQCENYFSSFFHRQEKIDTEVKHCCESMHCRRSCPHSGILQGHERIHPGEKPLAYEQCGKTSFSSSLKAQERIDTVKKPYRCKQCGKTFAFSGALRRREKSHTGENPYECMQCGKTFPFSSYLKEHERIHTGEKPYGCKQCGKTYVFRSSLGRHERSHTGHKPYTCKQCGKTFILLHFLQRHERIHTGEKPYGCKQCGKTFVFPCSLRRHERIHTERNPINVSNVGKHLFFPTIFTDMKEYTKEKPYRFKQYGKIFVLIIALIT